MKKALYGAAALALAGQASIVSAIDVKGTKGTTTGDNGTDGDFIQTLDNMLGYVTGLLYFIAVCVALWSGFQILTSAGDEEKVKKGRQTLIYAIVGLGLIFLASQIISWIINLGSTTIK